MARAETWMPLYIGDYLADTMHLTTRQHGAYMLLLMHAWRSEGYIPASFEKQAAIVRMTVKDWHKDHTAVVDFFKLSDRGLSHKRVLAELAVARAMTEQRSAAGKASAAKRERDRQQNGNDNPTVVDIPLPPRTKPSQSPSQSPNSEANASAGGVPARDVLFAEALPWLIRKTGKTRAQAATLLGQWCRDFGDDATLAALTEAEAENPIDPVPWIVAKFKPREVRETYEQKRLRETLAVIEASDECH